MKFIKEDIKTLSALNLNTDPADKLETLATKFLHRTKFHCTLFPNETSAKKKSIVLICLQSPINPNRNIPDIRFEVIKTLIHSAPTCKVLRTNFQRGFQGTTTEEQTYGYLASSPRLSHFQLQRKNCYF